jgi:aminoglycoside 6'-N-acetyltransferase
VASDEVLASEGDLLLRRMREDDLPLMARWRNEPHVRRWWEMDDDPIPYTLDDAREDYRPDLRPHAPTTSAIVMFRDRSVGYVQWYRWADYAEGAAEMDIPDDGHAFGLDIFIGELDAVGMASAPPRSTSYAERSSLGRTHPASRC